MSRLNAAVRQSQDGGISKHDAELLGIEARYDLSSRHFIDKARLWGSPELRRRGIHNPEDLKRAIDQINNPQPTETVEQVLADHIEKLQQTIARVYGNHMDEGLTASIGETEESLLATIRKFLSKLSDKIKSIMFVQGESR